MLALLIERIPLTSEAKTHKVLHICTRFQLKEQGEEDVSTVRISAVRQSGYSMCIRACVACYVV